MGFKIKNSLTGEFEKLPILTLKGEKGETGGVEEYNKVDYMGNKYETLKQANDANVEYAVKTAIGEFNYLDYDGQHITATNTIAGQAKNATLKGQTLVSLTKAVHGNGRVNKQYGNTVYVKLELLKPSTQYIAYIFNDGEEDVELYWNSSANFQWKTFVCKSKAITYSIGASKANFNDNDLIFSVQTTQTLPQNLRCVILEYQEGMENWDVPYFEGMASCKAPVLRTVGKNLFDGELELGAISGGINQNWREYFRSKNFIPIKPNTAYGLPNQILIDNTLYNGKYELNFYDNDKKYISTVVDKICITPPNAKFMRICYFVKQNFEITLDKLNGTQIYLYENGTTNDEFEPYKSNILTVNEGVELGSVGEAKDELNLLTGQLTQRTETRAYREGDEANSEVVTDMTNTRYKLPKESIKTVDLSDNHVYSYKDVTHYDCSSAEGSLVPTLSVKVPTDVQATIAQQRETIQTLNSENERLNQIQEALKASMLDSQVQLMNLSWDTDFEVFTLRESIAPKDSLMDSKIGSNIDKFSQAKFIIENDCPDLEKLNSQIEYYFSKDVFSQEQFEELTDLISIVKGGNGCEY